MYKRQIEKQVYGVLPFVYFLVSNKLENNLI